MPAARLLPARHPPPTTCAGYVQTVMQVVQLVGGLISGPLIDMYGTKLVLLLSYSSSAVCYAMTGSAHSMTLIYLSRLPTLLQARAAAADAARAVPPSPPLPAARPCQRAFLQPRHPLTPLAGHPTRLKPRPLGPHPALRPGHGGRSTLCWPRAPQPQRCPPRPTARVSWAT